MGVLCHTEACVCMKYFYEPSRAQGPKLAAMTSRSYWTAVWCGFLVLTIGLGVRQSFGIFLKPVSAELHVGRELFSFGTALSMLLMGAVAPFAGRLCDRFGSAVTIAGGISVGAANVTLVGAVNADHHSTMRVRTKRGPMRSPNTPLGISNAA